MRQLLRSGGYWLGSLSLLLPVLGQAQCPVAAGCTPGSYSGSATIAQAYNMGIYNVTLGSINNSTGGYLDGYKDYSCTVGATLTVGRATSLSIKNGALAPENVRVWIDYNNDGTFADAELAYSDDAKLLHTGTITPPATAVLGTRLRLRVASDYSNSTTTITACSTPQFSQDEDYAVTLVAGTTPPTAAFTTSGTTTCSGCVQLTDQSAGAPTSWLWDFGDNTSSTAQSPQHCYAQAGTYQVRLTATNASGSSTSAATAITYNTAVPVAACAGQGATSYCCNYGITQVKLGTLTNASADGSAGYQDFTCAQRVSLTVGVGYTLAISTGGANPHDTRAWLDLNNDGQFAASEKVLEVLNATSPSATIILPASTVLGQPLRLRLVADGVGTNPQPCVAPTLGQVEDYTVTAQPNTSPPAVAFTSSYVAGVCTGSNTFTFTDQSTNLPTAWQWSFSPSAGVSFVDGTSASSQNPHVAFAAAGYYTATLAASNANGSTTLSKPNYLLVQLPCLSYCAANGGYSGFNNTVGGFWISSVSVTAAGGAATFSSTATAYPSGGYAFLAATPVALVAGGTQQTLSVSTNVAAAHRTSIWIDYNRDGTFSNSTGTGGELVYNGLTTGAASVTLAVPGTLSITRMRVLVASDSNTPNACATYYGSGDVLDFIVAPATALASHQAAALPGLTLSPNPTPDGQLLVQASEPGAAGRYAVVVENVLGAQLLSQSLQLLPGTPASLSLEALPAGLYLVRLTNEQGQTALRRIVRQ